LFFIFTNYQEEKMKKNFGIVLAVALGLSALLLTIAFQAGWVRANPFNQERAGAPTIVSYQGQIWDGDTPYNGTGYFKFAILDATGTTYYWSNDGGELGIPPEEYIALPVENGLFTVYLGDNSLYGSMTALSADVFDDPDTRLRVWFSPDTVTFTQLPDQKIAAVPYALQAQLAADADTLDGVQGSGYQFQVTGSCPVGQAVRAINSDGTVVCETLAVSPTFSLSTIDSTGLVGRYSSMAIGTDGLGLISYYDAGNGDLKVAHCTDTNCSSATSYTLDSTGNVGLYTSIAIGTDGFGLISYHDDTNKDLKVAHCNNTACSSATSYRLDSLGEVGYFTSIAIGADGFGLISYFDNTLGDLKVAHCNNTACNSGAISLIDENKGIVGYDTDIAIGTDGLGLISYYDLTNGNLKVAHCSNIVCSSATLSTIDSEGDVGSDTSITISGYGAGLISYIDKTNNILKVAQCDDITCTSAYTTSLNSGQVSSGRSSIAIGIDGYGVISFWSQSFGLRIAHCANDMCSDATLYTLDTNYMAATGTSIAIGSDGFPLISYDDDSYDSLKVAHCSNELCIPINWEP
jgi:hypothetical protein